MSSKHRDWEDNSQTLGGYTMNVHKDICIRFVAMKGGETRRFKAVGFLKEGESPVDGDEMLRRVPKAIGEEDSNFLDECVDQDWSEALWPYFLVTARRCPDDPRGVRCFFWNDILGWLQVWCIIDCISESEECLVVCLDDA
ncbi:MAG: hypothetical protein A2224_01715 [Candidatus Magasanikbacteria bacterium RIFOXYA2_FULL_40_20]|nr:MAG: hypothetical protein A2224_01715 [Candidatus Magasanikbacteria bacterium RIFOXYA2_FULL_40_20]